MFLSGSSLQSWAFLCYCCRNVLGCLLSSQQPLHLPASYTEWQAGSHAGSTAGLLKPQHAQYPGDLANILIQMQ